MKTPTDTKPNAFPRYTILSQNLGRSDLDVYAGPRGRVNAWDAMKTIAVALDKEHARIGGTLIRVLKDGVQVWSATPGSKEWADLLA